MQRRTKGCIVGAVVFYGIFAALLIVTKLTSFEDLDSSPTETRDLPGYRSGRLGLLEEADRSQEDGWPATVAMGDPAYHELEEGVRLFLWPGEEVPESIPEPQRWTDRLEGDDSIELVAVASWYPQADDPVGEGAPAEFPLSFRDASTLEPIDQEELEQSGVPPEFFRIAAPDAYPTPRIRFLFKTRNVEHVEIRSIDIGDTVTGAEIGYDLEQLGEIESRFQLAGDWCAVDSALLVWHDTPIRCLVQMLTGDPIEAELPREPGAQVRLGDSLRLQWVANAPAGSEIDQHYYDEWSNQNGTNPTDPASVDGIIESYLDKDIPITVSFQLLPEKDEDAAARGVVRTTSADLLDDQVAVRTEDGLVWGWDYESESEPISLYSQEAAAGDDGPVRLLFLPRVAELEFSLRGIPDAPNPANPEDLWEVDIPRLTLSADLNDAEQELIGLLSTAALVSWDRSGLWDEKAPKNLPEDRTFRNQTPQQLINWYLKNTSGSFIRYDPANYVLYVNEKEDTWWNGVLDWLRNRGVLP